jgi:hypothetical protein
MTKEELFQIIKEDNLFRSYEVSSAENVSDDLMIEHVLVFSDVDVIASLFKVFSHGRIRDVWERRIVPDARYKRLNVYLGRIFFGIEDIGSFIHEKTEANSRYGKLERLVAGHEISPS